jgi:uncharacterized membrane protein
MNWLIETIGDHWYLVVAIGGVLVLAFFVVWRLTQTKNHAHDVNTKTTFLDVILIWPWLLKHDRKSNSKSHWLTRREVILAILMIAIIAIAIFITPAGRTR